MLRRGSRVSSQHQQIRFLASQFLLDEGESIAALDRNHRSALTQSRSLDEPGQRLLKLPPDWRAMPKSGSRLSEEITRKAETRSGMMTQGAIIPLWAGDLPSFFLWAERQGRGRDIVLETSLVCVKKVEARLGKERCRKPYSRCRSVREINRDEDPLVRRLIWIADDQYRPLNLP